VILRPQRWVNYLLKKQLGYWLMLQSGMFILYTSDQKHSCLIEY
jgi:hypothetical protein